MFIGRMLRRTALVATAASLALSVAAAQARELRVSVFEPPQGFYPVHILKPWIEKVNAELSEGNSLRMYPGAILGSPVAQRDLVLSGAADIALVVPTYTPGIFPGTSVVEVPYLAKNSVEGANLLNSLFEEGLIAEEYKDFKVIGLFSTPGYNVVSTKEGVRKPSDISGYKMRIPSTYMNRLLGNLGATSVSLPATQVYEGLERKVIDATMWNYNATATFRLYEPAQHVTVTKLGVTPMAILMNKAAYEALSPEDRAVIDANAGRDFSKWAGEVSDQYEEDVRQRLLGDGSVTEYTPSAEEQAEWEKSVADAAEIWVSETNGLDPEHGRKIIDSAKALTK